MIEYVGRTTQQSLSLVSTLRGQVHPASARGRKLRLGCNLKRTSQPRLTSRRSRAWGGRITQANVEFDDHPSKKRFSDRIETVTVDSVFEWMARAGLGAAPVALKL